MSSSIKSVLNYLLVTPEMREEFSVMMGRLCTDAATIESLLQWYSMLPFSEAGQKGWDALANNPVYYESRMKQLQ